MAGQGFGVVQASATPTDHSITIRGIRFVPGDSFSDLETWPFNDLAKMLESRASSDKMSDLMKELYRSLKTIFGSVVDPFWVEETSRLTLHTSEIMLLAGAAVGKLNENPHYRAGADQANKTSGKLTAGAEFAGAVAAKLNPAPVQPVAPNPAEQDLARQIQEMQRELARLTNMNTPMAAHPPDLLQSESGF